MRTLPGFSFVRFRAIIIKEFIQMRRDRLTFGLMIGVPLAQVILFGFAINSDPKHLPAAVVMVDSGPQARALLSALAHTGYFDFVREVHTEAEGRDLLARGQVQFVITVPEGFTRDLLRGASPALLIEADATDPGTTGNALGVLPMLLGASLRDELKGPLAYLAPAGAPVEIRVHPLDNPEAITQFNIVPRLMGVVLTLTMVIITGPAITRERESGTMENLLSMPTRPFEVLLGKIIPYILVGYIQVSLILATAHVLFHVPVVGSLGLLYLVSLLFITANLAMGVTFSAIAGNQRQAMQMAVVFFLPSMLLSGFMFPFRGMPHWAQAVGEVLPLTHFLRIVRGILLKGNGWRDVVLQAWQIALFAAVALAVGVKRYHRTLD
jgi:ABC-2 type transport system permease protein